MDISVVIPAYNAERIIARTLNSLLKQNYPKSKFEIIVVDDASKDKTASIVSRYRKVKLFKQPHGGPAVQRNFGARMAKGDIILFIDSDCIVQRNTLKRIKDNFKKNIAGVGGVYKTLNKNKIVSRYIGYEIGYRHEKSPKETNFLGSYCCAYKRDIFLKYKGFDENFPVASGEDPELSFRIADAGHKLILDKNIFVWHAHVEKLGKYIRQQFWRAFWRVLMYRKHPKKIKGDPYSGNIPLITVTMALFLVSLPFSLINFNVLYLSLAFLIIFYLLNLGFIFFAAKRELKMLLFVPFVVFFRTIAWILGFIYGQLKL